MIAPNFLGSFVLCGWLLRCKTLFDVIGPLSDAVLCPACLRGPGVRRPSLSAMLGSPAGQRIVSTNQGQSHGKPVRNSSKPIVSSNCRTVREEFSPLGTHPRVTGSHPLQICFVKWRSKNVSYVEGGKKALLAEGLPTE